jgi:membrane-associated phospholipid phosphatase
MEKISRVISYMYHPLIIPSLGILMLFNSGTYLSYLPFGMKKGVLLIVFLCTCIIPLLFIPYLIYQRLILNIHMESRRERYAPLVFSLVLNIFCYFLIRRTPIPQAYASFILSSIIAILATMLITLNYKISIHMVGAGGLVALIGFISFSLKVDLQFYLGISLILAGITGAARIALEAHTPGQVYTGFLTGFTFVLLTMILS